MNSFESIVNFVNNIMWNKKFVGSNISSEWNNIYCKNKRSTVQIIWAYDISHNGKKRKKIEKG